MSTRSEKLTSPSGDRVYLNLDVMIGMQRNPDINITFLQSVSDPRVNIAMVACTYVIESF
jgi:hypothetical protein